MKNRVVSPITFIDSDLDDLLTRVGEYFDGELTTTYALPCDLFRYAGIYRYEIRINLDKRHFIYGRLATGERDFCLGYMEWQGRIPQWVRSLLRAEDQEITLISKEKGVK